jgi:hypothetical protein
MLTTVEGHYVDGKVELQETPHHIDRARVLVTFLPDGTENDTAGHGVDLFGVWKDRVPADADIDVLLRDIRAQWSDNVELPNE